MLLSVFIISALTLLGLFVLFVLILLRQKKRARLIHLEAEANAASSRQNLEQLKEIAHKLDHLLTNKKMYTNPELSIYDVASMVGTNRSYISSSINTFYNQNFCSYINQYRLNELKKTIKEANGFTQKELAIRCGFGSVDTMKRTIKQKTGLTMKEWKDRLLEEDQNIDKKSGKKRE